MTTNPFLNLYGHTDEQNLLDDLMIECIKATGMDMYYLPRKRTAFDQIYYEDNQSVFDQAYLIEVYMRSWEGFMGVPDMTKFGYTIHDQFKFTMSRTRFEHEIKAKNSALTRPREGDLLYFTLNKRLFEITFVDNKTFFYQLGDLQIYDLSTELYRYSNERFETGIEDIDSIMENSTNVFDYAIRDTEGNMVLDEANNVVISTEYDTQQKIVDPAVDNREIEGKANTSANLFNWTEKNPFANNSPWD